MKRIVYILIMCNFLLCACRVQQPIGSEQFGKDVRKDIPFAPSTLEPVADHAGVFTFKCDNYVDMLPDYEVDADGAVMGYRTTFMPTHDKQPANVIWRNIVINRKDKRLLCIDRLLKILLDFTGYGCVNCRKMEASFPTTRCRNA